MNSQELAEKVKKHSLLWQFGGAMVVLWLVGPALLLMFKAGIALAILAALFSITVAFGPLWSKMLANWSLKAAIAEASRNPIETLRTGWSERTAKLQVFAREVQAFYAKILDTKDQYEEFVKKYPQDGEKFRKMIEAMETLLAKRRKQHDQAARALQQQRTEIDRAEAMFKMAQAANSLQRASGSTIDIMQQIMEETALERVGNEVNMSFAQLDQLMLERVDDNIIEGQVVAKEIAHVHS